MRANTAVLRFGLSLGLLATASGSALAQLTGETTTTTTTTTDTEVPPTVPAQQQQQQQTTTTTTIAASTSTTVEGGKGSKTVDSAVDGRPSVLSFGIGFGFNFPTDITMPNTTSVRLRLASGLTFEPMLTLGVEKQATDPGDTSDQVTTVQAGTLVRLPFMHNSKFDFEGLLAGFVGTEQTNPDGDDNNTSTTAINLSWGIAVNYWLTPHWSLSMSAYTPFFSYSKQTMETPGGDEASIANTDVGVIWVPTVVGMLHLYY